MGDVGTEVVMGCPLLTEGEAQKKMDLKSANFGAYWVLFVQFT